MHGDTCNKDKKRYINNCSISSLNHDKIPYEGLQTIYYSQSDMDNEFP